jgi:glycosyltransferase involved in cell wall biosynthesis
LLQESNLISLIVSSANKNNLDALSKSVLTTIGIPYELIEVYNPGKMSICEAYNKGAAKARYDILCFVHDDVEFITPDWGKNILQHFADDPGTGILGVGGSICKCRMASAWPQPVEGSTAYSRLNVKQQYKHSQRENAHDYINPFNEKKSHVITLDGVLLITKKETWQSHPFDEKLLKGFHGYDLDFSMNIGRKKNNYVIYDVLLVHKSEGVNDMNWFKGIFLVYNKWKKMLPICVSEPLPAAEYERLNHSWFHYLLTIKAKTRKEKLQKLFLCTRLIPEIGLKKFKQQYFSFFVHHVLKKALL